MQKKIAETTTVIRTTGTVKMTWQRGKCATLLNRKR